MSSAQGPETPKAQTLSAHSLMTGCRGHSPETDKYRTVNATMRSERDEPGAERGGAGRHKLAGGSEEVSVVSGLLWRAERKATQAEETTPAKNRAQATKRPPMTQDGSTQKGTGLRQDPV